MLVVFFLPVILPTEAAPLPERSIVVPKFEPLISVPDFVVDPIPQSSSTVATIVSQHQHLSLNGDYAYGYVANDSSERFLIIHLDDFFVMKEIHMEIKVITNSQI